MGVEKIEVMAAVTKHAGNAGALGTAVAWLGEKASMMSVQDWVAIAVGVSAVISYLTSTICTIIKTKREGEKKPV